MKACAYSVDIAQAKQIILKNIENTLNTNRRHVNACLHGSPGIGKSEIISQIAKQLGMVLIDLRLSAMQESDVLGIPYTDNGVMKFSTPAWWPDGSTPSILFLDEIKNAPVAVQAAAYRLILDRSIQNGSVLPSNCFIIAAGNMKDDKTGARDLLPAVANRFGLHLVIDKNRVAEPFLDYAVEAGWDRNLIGFLSWQKDFIYRNSGVEEAFCTPRTWEFVNEHLKCYDDPVIRSIAIAGAVGSEASLAFSGYLEYTSKLPQWKLIRNGDEEYSYVIPAGDFGLSFAVATGVAFELLDALKNGTSTEVFNLCSVVDQLQTDMLVVMFRTMKRDTAAAMKIFSDKNLRERFDKIRKYIK